MPFGHCLIHIASKLYHRQLHVVVCPAQVTLSCFSQKVLSMVFCVVLALSLPKKILLAVARPTTYTPTTHFNTTTTHATEPDGCAAASWQQQQRGGEARGHVGDGGWSHNQQHEHLHQQQQQGSLPGRGSPRLPSDRGGVCRPTLLHCQVRARIYPSTLIHPHLSLFNGCVPTHRIRPQAESAGMCRIIPPEGWVPPFTINEDAFKFPTRLQNLSRLGVRRSPFGHSQQALNEQKRARDGWTTSIQAPNPSLFSIVKLVSRVSIHPRASIHILFITGSSPSE